MKLKCWQGNFNGNYEGLVVANSQRKAVEVIGTSLYDFNMYWHLRQQPEWAKPLTLYVRKFDSQNPWTEKKIGVWP